MVPVLYHLPNELYPVGKILMGTNDQRAAESRFGLCLDRRTGSTVTYVVFVLYLALIPLKFQIPWILVYIQLLLFSILVLRIIGGLRTVRFTKTQLSAIVVLSMTLIATIVGQLTAEQGRNLDKLPEVSRFLVIVLVCALDLNSTWRIRRVLSLTAGIAALVGLLSVVNIFITLPFAYTGQVRPLGPISLALPRSLGIWMTFGSYGILAVIGATYAGMCAFRPAVLFENGSHRRIRSLSTVALGLIVLAVYLGKSRSTILAFVLLGMTALVVTAFHPDPRFRFRSPILPLGLLLSGLGGAVLKSSSVMSTFINANAASAAGRWGQYRFAVELMAQRPLWGWGWQYFETAFGTSYTVHNIWFLVGVSLGVPVFFLWVYMFYRLGRDTIRQTIVGSPEVKFISIIGSAMLVGGIVELSLYPGFTPISAVLLGILVGIVGINKE